MLLQTKDVSDLISWKSLVSLQLDNLLKDNALLRSVSFPHHIHLIIYSIIFYNMSLPDDLTASYFYSYFLLFWGG